MCWDSANVIRFDIAIIFRKKQKVIQLFDIKMLFPCIVLIIIIQKRLRMNNIYYLFTGVRNDENIKFPRHSPSQMTIFNASSSKGKVATLSVTRFFFPRQKTHLTRQIDCNTISIGHQINLMILYLSQDKFQ